MSAGLKVIDATGGMMSSEWEPKANQLANAT